MRQSRVRYIFTWVALGLLLLSGLCLMILSWNGAIKGSPSAELMVTMWVLMSGSGIFLFQLAVKKAHRLWIDDERTAKKVLEEKKKASLQSRSSSSQERSLDVAATARKLARGIPDGKALEESGQDLLKNLARELEIMSGIVYFRKNNEFKAVATYALNSPSEPYTFKEGEGLAGQAAANRQSMFLTNLPEGYLEVFSGLGKAEPSYLAIVPIERKKRTIAVLECSGYRYDPKDVEAMFKILARDLSTKKSPQKK